MISVVVLHLVNSAVQVLCKHAVCVGRKLLLNNNRFAFM